MIKNLKNNSKSLDIKWFLCLQVNLEGHQTSLK
jgi:hypothetical protein